VVRLDYLLLKLLIAQVNDDLKDLLQVNLFSLNAFGEGETEINGNPLSKSEERLLNASALARSILDNPPVYSFQTARQRAAAELLYYWGRLLQPPETQPNHKNLLFKSIRNYIACLGENEARPFSCLLDDVQEETKSQTKTTKPQERQNEILRIICDELKLDPLNLPPRILGKRWIRAEVKDKLKIPNKLFTESNFEKTWECLRKLKLIKEASDPFPYK